MAHTPTPHTTAKHLPGINSNPGIGNNASHSNGHSNGASCATTVSVASKLPMDLILHLHDKITRHEPVMGGGTRTYAIFQKRFPTQTFVVQGNAYAQNKGPQAKQISAGYAITHGIPKAFWDEWVEQQAEHEAVKNHMVLAHVESASTIAQTREYETARSGMERLDPHQLHRHGLMQNVQQVAV